MTVWARSWRRSRQLATVASWPRVRGAAQRSGYAALERLYPTLRPLLSAHPRRWPVAALRAHGKSRWPDNVPIRFVTSFSDSLFEESGRRCVTSFRALNPGLELHAYLEADSAKALEAMLAELQQLGVVAHRLDATPTLHAFQSQLADLIPTAYGGDGDEVVFAPRPGDEQGYWRRNMIRWARKVAAIEAASAEFRGILVWVDSDTHAKAPITRTVLSRWFAGAGVFHLKAGRTFSETGVLGFDLTRPGVRRLVEAMCSFYLERHFLRGDNWSDCIAFDYARALPGMPPARDLAVWADLEGHVVEYSPLSSHIVHDKGNHRRGGFYSSSVAAR
jgi:hypothetical protein